MRRQFNRSEGRNLRMRSLHPTLGALGLLLLAYSCQASASYPEDSTSRRPSGAVVAVGGGGTPAAVVQRGLELASKAGTGVRVAVVPFASARENRGVGSVEMWRAAGASSVALVPEDERARDLLKEANLIWLGGGSQQRLMEALERLDLVELIRERHGAGAVVGGTSAGAAVLGGIMISGDPEPDAYTAGAMTPLRSLELIPGVIVDQHFRERRREGRLISALIDRPRGWFGLGISEATAAIFVDGAFDVMGEGVVLLFDTREATVSAAAAGARRSASGITLSVHRPGEQHRLRATSGP